MAQSDHEAVIVESLLKRDRHADEHIKSCATGYRGPFRWWWESHHVVTVGSMKDSRISTNPETLSYIWNFLYITDWNINAEPNCIGLDTKWPYYMSGMGRPLPPNLPSHRIGHNDYNQDVYEYMGANVWDSLKEMKSSEDPHQFPEKGLEAQLKAASKFLRGLLQARGIREGGTLHCWAHRYDEDMKDRWYVPLSMSENPRKRNPGLRNTAFLENALSAIK